MPKCGNNIKTKTRPGFTIIEVVLVLAIAGLIFLMVFLALPALQRAQRDTQRRDDMARFAAQVAQYQTNNRGRVPNQELKAGLSMTNSPNADTTQDEGAKFLDVSVPLSTGQQGAWSAFLNNYMWAANDDFTDPGGTPYMIGDHGMFGSKTKGKDGKTDVDGVTSLADMKEMDFIIHVWHGAICGTEEGTVEQSTSGSARKLAFIYKLEGSGFYCGEV